MPATHLNEVIPDYEELEAKVKRVIGYGHEDKVSWVRTYTENSMNYTHYTHDTHYTHYTH